MKQLYTLFLASLCLFSFSSLHAQWIDSVSVSPGMLTDCTPINVTAFCTAGCNNVTINGTTISVAGNVISMNIDVTQPLICTPALLFFSQSRSITVPAGSYTLNVNYVQNGSVATSSSRQLSVSSCCPADPAFSQSVTGSICAGDSINFTASVLNQFSYTWKVDGNVVSNATSETYTFPSEGTYSVTLVVSDSTCDDSASVMVNVGNYPTIGLDSIVDESCAGASDGRIFITPSGGIPPYSYTWQNGYPFQDQQAATGGSLWLEVVDRYGCSSRDTFTVGTGSFAAAGFVFKDRFALCVKDSLDLTNTSSGTNTYQWLENGSAFSSMQDVRISFDSAGLYEISLVAIKGTCRDTASQVFSAIAPGTVAANILQPSCPNAMDGSIDISINGGLAPFSYNWSGGAQTKDIAMLDSGFYVLFVEDSAQCAVRDTFRLDLMSEGLEADFSFTRPNDTVYFRDQSDTSAVAWEWDFGDGSTSNEQNPQHVFTESREFTICLIATDGVGCQDTTCSSITYTVGVGANLSESIKVYPNPFNKLIRIDIPEELGSARFSVFDLQGRLLHSSMYKNSGQVFDLGALEKGLYWIRIEGEGWKYTKALLKE